MSNQITVDILANTKNLVAGVKETNTQLGTLGASVSKIGSAFSGLTALFGAQLGINFFKSAIQGAIEDEKAFKSLADLYGKDIDGIVKKVNEISNKFYIDDGAVAKYFVQLKSSFSSNFDKFVPTVVEASATLALLTGKPLEEVISIWAKALKDGKLSAQEVQKLGIDLTSEQEKQFNSLKTTAERLTFVLDIVKQKQKDALDNIDPWTKFNKIVGDIKDSIGAKLLPTLDKLVKIWESLTPAQQENVKTFVAWGLAIGGAIATIGLLAAAFNSIVVAFTTLGPLIAGLRAGFVALTLAMATNPFTGIAVVIAAVIAGIVLLIKNWDAVTAAFRNAGEAISSGISALRSGVGNIIDNIKSWFGNLVPQMLNIGKDIISGIVNGIMANAMAPINAVKSIGTNLVNTFKNFFKIGSPSKLFAGYGKNIVQGLSNGITNAQNLAVSSMNTMSARIASPSFNLAGAGGSPVNVTINAGIGTDPYELGRVVSAALDKYQGVNGRR